LAGINYPSYATSTLAISVSGYLMLKNFIDNLIAAATIILLMLSILLIYSLMIGDVEEKTYEFGMLRALGF
jgi:ABC-type antimicrobial peptide transport system permease subunit